VTVNFGDIITYGAGSITAAFSIYVLYMCVLLCSPSFKKKYWEDVYEQQRKLFETSGGWTTLRFGVYWSEKDQRWIGRCNEFTFEFVADSPKQALAGIMDLVIDEVEGHGWSKDYRPRVGLSQ
jgi:hypothetical protein